MQKSKLVLVVSISVIAMVFVAIMVFSEYRRLASGRTTVMKATPPKFASSEILSHFSNEAFSLATNGALSNVHWHAAELNSTGHILFGEHDVYFEIRSTNVRSSTKKDNVASTIKRYQCIIDKGLVSEHGAGPFELKCIGSNFEVSVRLLSPDAFPDDGQISIQAN